MLLTLLLPIIRPAEVVASGNYNYTQYSLKNGLCDDYVTHTFFDSEGYVWISTTNGLDRLDGNEFVHYSTSETDEHFRLTSNLITCVTEDAYRHLWVATSSGLSVIDLTTGWILNDFISAVDNQQLSGPVRAMALGCNNDIWISLSNYVVRLQLDSKGFPISFQSVILRDDQVSAICATSSCLWVGGVHGLYTIAQNQEGLELQSALDPVNQQSVQVVTSLACRGSFLWIGTNNGLFCFNTQTRELSAYRYDSSRPDSMHSNNVVSLAFNQVGELIVAHASQLDLLADDGSFRLLPLSRSDNNSTIINHVMVDKDNRMWVSMMVNGLLLISPNYIDYTYLFDGPQENPNVISRIYEDHDGNFLLSVLNKGLGFCPAGGNTIHYLPDFEDQNIMSVCQDGNEDYWISSYQHGLFYLRHQDLSRPVYHHIDAVETVVDGPVYEVLYDARRNCLWLAVGSSLQCLDLGTKEVRSVKTDIDIDAMMPYTLFLDSHDRLWVGGIGVAVVSLSQQDTDGQYKTQYYQYKLDDLESCIAERVSVIYEASDGSIYLGSQNNGLYRYNEGASSSEAFQSVPINFGFFHNKVSSLLEDSRRHLWVSTPEGLFCYDIASEKSVKADEEDGLPCSSFFVKSGIVASDGRICIGSTNGLLCLNSELSTLAEICRKPHISQVVSSDGRILPDDNAVIDIYPDNHYFEIFYSAQEYVDPEEVFYRYRIDEINDEWSEPENHHHSIRFSMLPPGEYTFRISCTNPDISWSEQESVLYIVVHPRFYQTWWFILIVSLFLLSLVIVIVLAYLYREKVKLYLIDHFNFRNPQVSLSEAYSSVEIEDADKAFLERLTSVVEQNYSNASFGVMQLQEALGMSSTTLYKKITSLTGLTSSQFIRLYRLQTAHKILEDQRQANQHISISEVAYMVGFNDPKYFTRCFVKQYGVQPSNFSTISASEN